jgi:hypothetical protein
LLDGSLFWVGNYLPLAHQAALLPFSSKPACMLAMNRLLWKRDVQEDTLQGLYNSVLSHALKKTRKYPTNTFVGLAAELQHHNPGDDAVTSGLLHVWGI